MEFQVAVAAMPAFRFAVPDPAPAAPGAPCRNGEPCPAATRAGGCLARACVAPVLDYFSGVVSHEAALVVCEADGQRTCFTETGQRAAFRLLLAGITQSGCPFFSRFAALPAAASLGNAYAAFARLLRALATQDGHASPTAAGHVAWELERHLAPIFGEAKRKVRQDAAVNACILMLNGLRLATDHVRQRRGGGARRPDAPAHIESGEAGREALWPQPADAIPPQGIAAYPTRTVTAP